MESKPSSINAFYALVIVSVIVMLILAFLPFVHPSQHLQDLLAKFPANERDRFDRARLVALAFSLFPALVFLGTGSGVYFGRLTWAVWAFVAWTLIFCAIPFVFAFIVRDNARAAGLMLKSLISWQSLLTHVPLIVAAAMLFTTDARGWVGRGRA